MASSVRLALSYAPASLLHASGLFGSSSVARVKARSAGSYEPLLSWNAPETSKTGTESALMASAFATLTAAISSHLGPSCLSNFEIWASASPAHGRAGRGGGGVGLPKYGMGFLGL